MSFSSPLKTVINVSVAGKSYNTICKAGLVIQGKLFEERLRDSFTSDMNSDGEVVIVQLL